MYYDTIKKKQQQLKKCEHMYDILNHKFPSKFELYLFLTNNIQFVTIKYILIWEILPRLLPIF